MNNWKVIPTIIFATVLIFGAGVFTGGLLVNHVKPAGAKKSQWVSSNALSSVSPTNAGGKFSTQMPELLTKPFLAKLDDQLKLSPEQHRAVEKIINEGQDDIKKTVKFCRMQIREALTSEQAKLFDALFKKPKKPADTNAPAVLAATNSLSAATNRP